MCCDSGSAVYGFLLFCEPGSMESLDLSERVDQGQASRLPVKVTVIEGELAGTDYEAHAYVATPEYTADDLKPTKDYLGHLLQASCDLPRDYVDYLLSFEGTALEEPSSQF